MPGSAIQRRRIAMRNAKLAMLVLLAAGGAAIAAATPAAAFDYPYCIQGGGWGVPGDCSYRSYAECQASLSGRYGYCNINPRVAFARQKHRQPHRDYDGRF
jgi:Protein of unknown function (DUF3551)